MNDLMIPILALIIMYIIIDAVDAGIVLLSIALIWIPLSFMMYSTITTNAYGVLFGATITDTPIALTTIGLMPFTVVLFAIGKMAYVRKVVMGENAQEKEHE